jgi:glycosyltransferase involved in cell wall biosynthesis
MRLGFDIRPFLKHETGVGVYFKNLLAELAKIDTENEYVLFSASWKDRFPSEKIPALAKRRVIDKKWPVRAVDALWSRWRRPTLDRIAGTRLDLTHSPSPLLLPTRGRTVVTVCDLFFMDFPGLADRQSRKHFLRRTSDALRDADAVVAISEFTKSALIERFGLGPEKITVTHLGLNPALQIPPAENEIESVRRAHGLPREFILFVGASEPRKNLPGLVEALSIIHERLRKIGLVIAGRPGGDADRLERRIAELGLGDWVRRLGYLSEADIRALFHAATAFAFPSLCEGFGLPLLEAMAGGLPAAVSGVGALPEIGGEAALYFDPGNPEDIAGALVRILSDGALRRDLRARGRERARRFQWSSTAARTLALYREVVGRG